MELGTEARVALLDGFALRLPPGCATTDADDLPHGVRLVAYPSLPPPRADRHRRPALARGPGGQRAPQPALRALAAAEGGARRRAGLRRHPVAGAVGPRRRPGAHRVGPADARPAVGGRCDDGPGRGTARRAAAGLVRRLGAARAGAAAAAAHARPGGAGREARGRGRYGEVAQAAYAAVVAEPLRESAHRAVVRVHLVEGNLAEAVRAYDAFRTMLAEELGVAPSSQMDRLISDLPRPRTPATAGRERSAGMTAR